MNRIIEVVLPSDTIALSVDELPRRFALAQHPQAEGNAENPLSERAIARAAAMESHQESIARAILEGKLIQRDRFSLIAISPVQGVQMRAFVTVDDLIAFSSSDPGYSCFSIRIDGAKEETPTANHVATNYTVSTATKSRRTRSNPLRRLIKKAAEQSSYETEDVYALLKEWAIRENPPHPLLRVENGDLIVINEEGIAETADRKNIGDRIYRLTHPRKLSARVPAQAKRKQRAKTR